jgi:hypothetical protein
MDRHRKTVSPREVWVSWPGIYQRQGLTKANQQAPGHKINEMDKSGVFRSDGSVDSRSQVPP